MKVKILAIAISLGMLVLSPNTYAAVNNMSLIPSWDNSKPTPACGQNAAIFLDYNDEMVNGVVTPTKPDLTYLLVSWNLDSPAVDPVCRTGAIGQNWGICAQYFPLVHLAADPYLFRLKLEHQLSTLHIMSIAIMNSSSGIPDIVNFSKPVKVEAFQPCPYTSAAPTIVPSTTSPTIDYANRGNPANSLYTVQPVLKWTSVEVDDQIFPDSSGSNMVTVSVAGDPDNFEKVYFKVTDGVQTGWGEIPENQKRMDRDGTFGFVANIPLASWGVGTTPKTVTVEAIGIPKTGAVVQLVGAKDYDKVRKGQHRIQFYKNIFEREIRVSENGNDVAGCGFPSHPDCLTLTGAAQSHITLHGRNMCGAKVKVGPGNYRFGFNLPWPGIETTCPVTVIGTIANNKKVTNFYGPEILPPGFSGQWSMGGTRLRVEDVNLVPNLNTWTGPNIGYVGNQNADHTTLLKNIFFDGGHNNNTCVNRYPVGGVTHTVVDGYFTHLFGNGNYQNALRVYVNSKSIANSNNRILRDVVTRVNQNTIGNCGYHGDLIKTDGDLLVDGFKTAPDDTLGGGILDDIICQGLFIPSGGNGHIVIDGAKFHNNEQLVGTMIFAGAVSIIGDTHDVRILNSSFTTRTLITQQNMPGSRRYQIYENPLGGPPINTNYRFENVSFYNSLTTGPLPGSVGDQLYTLSTTPSPVWDSPYTDVKYSRIP